MESYSLDNTLAQLHEFVYDGGSQSYPISGNVRPRVFGFGKGVLTDDADTLEAFSVCIESLVGVPHPSLHYSSLSPIMGFTYVTEHPLTRINLTHP